MPVISFVSCSHTATERRVYNTAAKSNLNFGLLCCGAVAVIHRGMSSRFPGRPPRLDRVFETVEPFYFVTFNTWERRPLLTRPEIHKTFQTFCQRAHTDFQISVGRYVLMPDHAHLFVFMPRNGMVLPQWVKSLRSVLGKQLLALGVKKPHWQEGFFDHLLRSSESYAQKWDYVQMNPVRAGLCAQPDDWPFQGEIFPLSF